MSDDAQQAADAPAATEDTTDTTSQADAQGQSDAGVEEVSPIGDDGSLNVDALPEGLRNAGEALQSYYRAELAKAQGIAQDAEQLRRDAEHFRYLQQHPEVLRKLADEMAPAQSLPAVADDDDMDVDLTDPDGVKRLVRKLGTRMESQFRTAVDQAQARLTAQLRRELGPVMAQQEWDRVQAKYPAVKDPTVYAKTDELMRRNPGTRLEVAALAAIGLVNEEKTVRQRATAAVRKGKAAAAATAATGRDSRVDKDSLRRPINSFEEASAAALERLAKQKH